MSRIILLLLLAPLIGACAHGGPGSIAGGECRIFDAPKYAVKGKTQYDQDWVDSTIEGGVGGCHWKRPQPRPASLDMPVKAAPAPMKPKRRSLLSRAKDSAKAAVSKVWPTQPVAPVEAAPAPPEPPAPVVVTQPQPAATPAPRSRLDRLLHPEADR